MQQPAGAPPPVSGYPSQSGTQPGPATYPQNPPPPGYYPYYEPPPPPPPPQDDPAKVRTHDGFYMRLGLGPGYGWGKSEVEDFEVSYSGGAFLIDIMLGGTIGNLVVIGGGLQIGQIIDPEAEITSGDSTIGIDTGDEGLGITTLGPFVDVYFGRNHGGHAGTMLGIGSIGLEGEDDDEVSTGWGWSLFGGYEFWVSDQWALGANVRYTRVEGERVFGETSDSLFDTEVTVKDTTHLLGVMFSAVLN